MQSIDQNWERAVENHLEKMEDRRASAHLHAPFSVEFNRHWEIYERICQDFLDYVDVHFESGAGFIDFMKHEVRGMLSNDVDAETLLDDFNDHAMQMEPVRDAENLSAIYKYAFSEISYMAAMARANSVPEVGKFRFSIEA